MIAGGIAGVRHNVGRKAVGERFLETIRQIFEDYRSQPGKGFLSVIRNSLQVLIHRLRFDFHTNKVIINFNVIQAFL